MEGGGEVLWLPGKNEKLCEWGKYKEGEGKKEKIASYTGWNALKSHLCARKLSKYNPCFLAKKSTLNIIQHLYYKIRQMYDIGNKIYD